MDVKEDLKEIIELMTTGFENDLFSKSEEELESYWYFKFDHKKTLPQSIYEFYDMLSLYHNFCRRWESHHNGTCCIIERVRDKYLMPKINEFAGLFCGVMI